MTARKKTNYLLPSMNSLTLSQMFCLAAASISTGLANTHNYRLHKIEAVS